MCSVCESVLMKRCVCVCESVLMKGCVCVCVEGERERGGGGVCVGVCGWWGRGVSGEGGVGWAVGVGGGRVGREVTWVLWARGDQRVGMVGRDWMSGR